MELMLTKRSAEKKSDLTRIRSSGDIPGILYPSTSKNQAVTVNGADFHAFLRSLPKGHLPTTIFELHLDGRIDRAIVKGIQYHPTTYKIQHVDFQILGDRLLTLKVPVLFVGRGSCVGVKLGGCVHQIIHHIRVRCAPAHIPRHFSLDIQHLTIGESRRVGEIDFGPHISPLTNKGEIVVIIKKK